MTTRHRFRGDHLRYVFTLPTGIFAPSQPPACAALPGYRNGSQDTSLTCKTTVTRVDPHKPQWDCADGA